MKLLTKKILSKFIHPAIVMLLEQRYENPDNPFQMTDTEYGNLSWLEKRLIQRERKTRKKYLAKKERLKAHESIMARIINPPDTVNEQAQMASNAKPSIQQILKMQLELEKINDQQKEAQSKIKNKKERDILKNEWINHINKDYYR